MHTTLFTMFIQARCAVRRRIKRLTNAHTTRRLRNENTQFKASLCAISAELDDVRAYVKHMEEDLDVEEIANSLGRQVDELNNKVEELENDDRNNSYMEEDDVEKMIESALDDELGKLAIDDTELLEYTSDLGDRVDDVEETLKTLENIDLDEVVENVDRLKRFLRSLKATLNELEV